MTLASDLDDLEAVLDGHGLPTATLLGHSWGAALAMAFAIRSPERVSRLVLLDPAPPSSEDYGILRAAYVEQIGDAMDDLRRIGASAAYLDGDPDACIARYRIHFRGAVVREADFERVITAFGASFRRQGAGGVRLARDVDQRLWAETMENEGFDLRPALGNLDIPTLVLLGDADLIPLEVGRHVAEAIPGARLVVVPECGHFSYLERPDEVRRAIDALIG